MTYEQTLNWLFNQLPMYQRIGQAAYKANLDNTLKLDAYFNHPHEKYKTIHVAGTNGKGSTSHMLASILQEAGYKTGLYTSPHLKNFRERIKINGEMIPEQEVVRFVEEHRTLFDDIKPSFFEMTVAMALKYFADQQVDIAIVEVGLGGRLDSTNIIHPLLSLITNISLDHCALLGNTIEQIATEKAGIIKPGTPIVIGTRDSAYDYVFTGEAEKQGAPIVFATDQWQIKRNSTGGYDLRNTEGVCIPNLEADLKGDYQLKNIPAVIETIHQLKKAGINIENEALFNGIAYTIRNTGLFGRWQQLNEMPYTICDTGHNEDGIRSVVSQIRNCKYKHLHLVLGVVNDKEIDHILDLLPQDAVYYFCKAAIPRALNEEVLAEKARRLGLNGKTYASVAQAYQAAKENASPDDMIYIGGSTFVVAEVI